MAPHSSTLAWKIAWTEEPDRLQSMGLLRVGQDWSTSLSLFTFMHWKRKWQPTPVFLPGESQGRGSLVGCRLRGCTRVGHKWSELAAAAAAELECGFPGGSDSKESACNVGDPDSIPGSGRFPAEGNGYSLQYSCLENSMDRETWRLTVHGVSKNWTQPRDYTLTFHFTSQLKCDDY